MSLLLSYYGDDFTGSTDTMEAMTRFGIRAAQFLEPPTPERLAQYGDLEVVGVAGVGRTLSPAEMDAQFPAIFEQLKRLGAPIVHYKLCSTFDSSPDVGSIGRAIDIGQRIIGGEFVPLLVASPILGRYSAFGNLFARSGMESDVFRLDRHPTMSQHPITPMQESDLRRHLARQTDKQIGLFDILQYAASGHNDLRARLQKVIDTGAEIVLFDVMYPEQLASIGYLLWSGAQTRQQLVFGSSGVENALVDYWRETGILGERPALPRLGAVEQLLVLSGSCSPVTERQIDAALAAGFAEVALEPEALLAENTAAEARQSAIDTALELLVTGRSVIVHSARGPQDARIASTNRQLERMGYDQQAIKQSSGNLLGAKLGGIGRSILEQCRLQRVVLSGGDTSSYVMRALGIEAVTVKGPFATAMPFCHAYAPGSPADGLEMIFKGGQTGSITFFNDVKQDTP